VADDRAAAPTAVERGPLPDVRGGEPAAVRVAQAPGKKRGRETTGDMFRSLGVVLLFVVLLWFLAQPPDSDEQEIRVIDPAGDVAAFAADVPTAPVPTGLPEQWRATSATVLREPSGLRVGYVTPSGSYAEYAASTAPREDYLPEITGDEAVRLEPVQVAGSTWEQYRDGDGSLSLVRSFDGTTVVVGTLRASAPLDELETLASALATG
jgi:hypothetical protein